MNSIFWASVIYVLIFAIGDVLAICNQCGTLSGVACLNQTTFSICNNGTITGPIQSCPPNSVCSDSSSICDSQSIQPADCPPTCGACSSDKRFACVNATTFAFCFGTQMPSSVMSTCPANQFCDTTVTAPPFCSTNLNNICNGTITSPPATTAPPVITTAPPVTTTVAPTTSTIAPVTTTTPQPSTYCQQIGGLNGARYTAPFQTNCQGYIYCYVYNGALIGSLYKCPGSTVFSNLTAVCVAPASYKCPPNF